MKQTVMTTAPSRSRGIVVLAEDLGRDGAADDDSHSEDRRPRMVYVVTYCLLANPISDVGYLSWSPVGW